MNMMDFNNMNINMMAAGKASSTGAAKKKAPAKKKEEVKDSVDISSPPAGKPSRTEAAKKKKPKKEEAKADEKQAETPAPPRGTVNLKFIHTNDFHGYVEELEKPEEEGIIGGITRMAGEIKELKKENPNGTITLDGGDIYDGGFYSKITKGEIVSKPFGAMGFDAITIGNHDVTWGVDAFADIAREIDTNFLGSANLMDLSPGSGLKFLKPYTILERNGVKIGVLGLTSPMTALSTPDKGTVKIEDPARAAEKFVKKLRDEEKVDMVVLLSHLGHDDDVKLAGHVQGIDLIVGAHSHTVMKDAEKVGDTVIVQAGGEGKYVGDLDIVFDPSTKKIVSYKENLVPITADIKPDPVVAKIIAPYIEKYEAVKNEVIGTTSEDLQLINNKRTNLCNLFVDTQKQDSDLAVTSMFSVRKGIEKGEVTVGDLFQMYPFDNELVQVKAKGATVLRYLEGGLRFVEPGKDNYALVSGLSYEFNPELLDGNRITSITFQGKKMTPQEFAKKNITISMDNYTAGKSYFKEAKMVKKYGRVFDIIKNYIKENSPLTNLSTDPGSKPVTTVPDPGLVANVKVGTITKDAEQSPSDTKFNCASRFYADAVKGDADMAFGYNKSISPNLPEGELDRAALKKFYYHDNELLTIKASGAQVLNFLESARNDRNLGKEQILSSGITYKYDTSQPEGKRIQEVTIGGKTLDRKELIQGTYTLSVDNFLYDAKFKGAEIIAERGQVFKALENYIRENSPLHVALSPSPGTDVNPKPPITNNPQLQEDRMKKLVALGQGKIKPEETNEFSLSKVRITIDAAESLKDKKEMIAGAKECVGVTMYTLTKKDMIQALGDKAQEGVPVRVVMDPHIHSTPEKLLERVEAQQDLLKRGVRFMEDPGDNIFCNHSKTISVDHQMAGVDKINWADYSDEYHDYGCTIEGGRAVNDVENFFNFVWGISGGKPLAQAPQNPDVEGGVPVKVCVTNPDAFSKNTPYSNITTNLTEVKKDIKGQYFSLTSKPVANRLMEAKEKDPGREIKILLNESIFLESGPAQKIAQEMMEKGIQVRLYRDPQGVLKTLHSAATTFDGSEASFGSANTTFGGRFSNREVNVNVVGADTLKPMEAQFDVDWEKNSREITPDDLKLAKGSEDEEKAKAYYDTPIEHIGEVLSIDVKRLQGALDRICSTVGYSDFKDSQMLEIKLAVQKLASMANKDNKNFDTIMDRFIKILGAETADNAAPEKETKVAAQHVKSVRQSLGNYIVLNNIAMNEPKADIDDLTGKFVAMFKSMADAGGQVDDTRDVVAAFAEKYGVE